MSRALMVLAVLGCAVAALADEPWLGKWESTDRKENFDAFVKALGVDLSQYGGDHKVYHRFTKEGDKFVHGVAVPDKNFKDSLEFKLGEEGTHQFNSTDFTFKYTAQGNDLVAEYNCPTKNKQIHDTYHVEGEELVKTYKTGDVVAKRHYKKFAGELPAIAPKKA